MATASFTVRFGKCDSDVSYDCLAAIFNRSADKEKYVAVCEVRAVPMAINDDTTNILGNQGVLSIDRITAASGGEEISPVKFDTGATTLSSTYIKKRRMPSSVTLSGGTIRRFGDCISTYSILKTVNFQAMVRAPNIIDSNDHSGRTSESWDIWHADGVSTTEPIVLREGEGIACMKRAWGLPQSMRFGLVVKVVSTGNVYKWMDSDIGTPDWLGAPLWSLMNETGSGIVLQVYIISFPDLGEENIPRFRLMKCEDVQDALKPGTSKTLALHDTSKSITDVVAVAGPTRVLAYAAGEGAITKYHDYQVFDGTIASKQKADTLRLWLGAGPYIRTTSAPNMNWDVLGRSEPEVWPGDRRGVGGGLDFPIILRPGQGLAVLGGGNGYIETSEQAYLDIEMAGYVYTPSAVYPDEDDVRDAVVYGPTGSDYTGNIVLPAVGDVRNGVKYGANGTEYTGTYTPTGYPIEDDVRDGVDYGPSSEYDGDLVLPAEADVKAGVKYGADGTEYTGTYSGGGGGGKRRIRGVW